MVCVGFMRPTFARSALARSRRVVEVGVGPPHISDRFEMISSLVTGSGFTDLAPRAQSAQSCCKPSTPLDGVPRSLCAWLARRRPWPAFKGPLELRTRARRDCARSCSQSQWALHRAKRGRASGTSPLSSLRTLRPLRGISFPAVSPRETLVLS